MVMNSFSITVVKFTHLTIPAAIKIKSSHTVTLNGVSVRNSYKYGMIGINVLGLFVISNSTFTNNTWELDHEKVFIGLMIAMFIGRSQEGMSFCNMMTQ